MSTDLLEKKNTPTTAILEHDYYDGCESGDCGGTCPHCTLSICKVCGGSEGSLTTECCGERIGMEQEKKIYSGELDYRSGQWFEGMRNRAMYKGTEENLNTETLYLKWLFKQPTLDLQRIRLAKQHAEVLKNIVEAGTFDIY